jgi:septal ring factor EnvC (AmiA/AmiB activator)
MSNTNNRNLIQKNLISSTKLSSLIFLIIFFFFYRIQNDLEAARGEIQIHQNELSQLHQQISQNEQIRTQLQNELEQLKQQCRQLERQISDKDESKKNADLRINQYRQELTSEKELRISKISHFIQFEVYLVVHAFRNRFRIRKCSIKTRSINE